jgi:xylulokinase
VTLVVGVDSSTQSCKVEVRRAEDGRVVGRGRAPHPATQPPRSEQHPESWWVALLAALDAALREVDRSGAARRDVAGIAIAGQQHGLVALDRARQVVRPAKLWNDSESAPDAAWLVDQLEGGARAWAAACGSVPVASFTIAKLSWLHRREPQHWARLAHVLLPHDWLTWRLTGAFVTDRGDASGTGYWSAASEDYRFDLLQIVDAERDWEATVPRVCDPHEQVGELFLVVAEELGLPRTAVVAPGTGDNMAAALGIGLEPGDVAVSIGTSGTVYAVADRPTADATGAVAGFADATGRHLPLVCTLNATQVTDATATWLGWEQSRLDRVALDTPAGAGGVVFIPYLAGERTPDRPTATGTLTGLRIGTRPEQLARAAYEGVVCGLLDGIDALDHAGVPAHGGRLVALGGGSRSLAYRQILADLAARQVTTVSADEHVAAGACVQAAAVLTRADPIDVARAWGLGKPAGVIDPDARVDWRTVRAAYADARDRHEPPPSRDA